MSMLLPVHSTCARTRRLRSRSIRAPYAVNKCSLTSFIIHRQHGEHRVVHECTLTHPSSKCLQKIRLSSRIFRIWIFKGLGHIFVHPVMKARKRAAKHPSPLFNVCSPGESSQASGLRSGAGANGKKTYVRRRGKGLDLWTPETERI